MVIDVVNVHHVAFRKAEDHAPVGADGDGPETSQVAFERVQPKTRQVHIRACASRIESCENVSQLRRVFPRYTARVVVLIKALQSPVAD